MVESVSGISIPLILCDAKHETSIGTIHVYPGLDFKSCQAIISRKIRISPNQFSVYLAEPMGLFTARRKTLITQKFDFSTIFRDNSNVFLVVLKRSRRERRHSPSNQQILPENLTILRRENKGMDFLDRFGLYGVSEGYSMGALERRIKNLEIERMRFLGNMALPIGGCVGFGGRGHTPEGTSECEKCARGETEFHACSLDPVVSGFNTSPFGPIAPPVIPSREKSSARS